MSILSGALPPANVTLSEIGVDLPGGGSISEAESTCRFGPEERAKQAEPVRRLVVEKTKWHLLVPGGKAAPHIGKLEPQTPRSAPRSADSRPRCRQDTARSPTSALMPTRPAGSSRIDLVSTAEAVGAGVLTARLCDKARSTCTTTRRCSQSWSLFVSVHASWPE
jgi:hypothetical protein